MKNSSTVTMWENNAVDAYCSLLYMHVPLSERRCTEEQKQKNKNWVNTTETVSQIEQIRNGLLFSLSYLLHAVALLAAFLLLHCQLHCHLHSMDPSPPLSSNIPLQIHILSYYKIQHQHETNQVMWLVHHRFCGWANVLLLGTWDGTWCDEIVETWRNAKWAAVEQETAKSKTILRFSHVLLITEVRISFNLLICCVTLSRVHNSSGR